MECPTEQGRPWITQAAESELFAGFSEPEIAQVTDCLGARFVAFTRGQVLARGNSHASAVGLVLSGSVYANAYDENGSRNLVSAMSSGDVFAEDLLAHALNHTEHTVTGAGPGRAMLLGMHKIVHAQGPLCPLRSRVVENLFRIMAAKNRMLQNKLQIVSRKSLRDRIVLFLEEQQQRAASPRFTVLFSRAELADYLNADRAALSRELTRMRALGLIDFHRNSFTVKPGLAAHWDVSRVQRSPVAAG
ncbi:Crp/Fnr family transcriptional regulator [Tomitella gaofuii]|uniref:Crp/Fnr family transcriptional regulator n=1 Tax=Tomitella gaofuii TaxID=2760083 RepID=UPI0015FE086A|nr:Crp/Fnr family transcriptional regulator [Tomitella gaofuii]